MESTDAVLQRLNKRPTITPFLEELTEAFDMADELLQTQRYLTGDTVTPLQMLTFGCSLATLLRFDEV
jgi:glutathionyl-hydroquinone reductase